MKINGYALVDKLIWLGTILFFVLSMTISWALGKGASGQYILLAVLFVIVIFFIIRNNFKISCNISEIHIYMLCFFLFGILSSLWATNSSLAMNRAIDILEMSAMIFILYWCYKDDTDIDRILSAIMWINYIVVFYAIYYYGWSQLLLIVNAGTRVSNAALNANTLGMSAAYAILISVYYVIYGKIRWWSVLIVPTIIVVAASGSKKALLLLVVGLFVLFVLKNFEDKNQLNRIFKVFLTCIIVVIVGMFILNLPLFSGIMERFKSMMNAFFIGGGDSSTEHRMELIEIGMNLFKNNLLVGVGLDNAQLYTVSQFGIVGYYLHNNYIEILADIGLIGFIFYYWIYILIICRFIKYRNFKSKEYVITLVILMLRLIMDFGMVSYESKTTYFYLLLFFMESKKLRDNYLDKGAFYA